MAKISNLSAYPLIADLDKDDYVLITDKENALQTKNVSIEQMQTFFGINTNAASVTVSAAELLTSFSAPVEIIPAPGAGKVIDILSIIIYYNPGTTVFDFSGFLNLKIDTVSFAQIADSTPNTATDLIKHYQVLTGNVAQNTALKLVAASNPTQGNGKIYFNIMYRTLVVGSSF
tara:strand:+ start:6337 stop:6858 length:522 start_codon:yes stop_codon:yes gene_type:complete